MKDSGSLPLIEGGGGGLEGIRRETERGVDDGRRAPEAIKRIGHERYDSGRYGRMW